MEGVQGLVPLPGRGLSGFDGGIEGRGPLCCCLRGQTSLPDRVQRAEFVEAPLDLERELRESGAIVRVLSLHVRFPRVVGGEQEIQSQLDPDGFRDGVVAEALEGRRGGLRGYEPDGGHRDDREQRRAEGEHQPPGKRRVAL